MLDIRSEIAAHAARLVVEDGLDYGSAKRRAARDRGVTQRGMLPDNHELEAAVREYLDLFRAESQPRELLALRRLALKWMERLAAFRPHLGGAVWSGTATAQSTIQIELFCDDAKQAEIALVNLGARPDPSAGDPFLKEGVSKLHLSDRCVELQVLVDIYLLVQDYDLLRGGLRANRHGQVPRGDMMQVRRLLQQAGDG